MVHIIAYGNEGAIYCQDCAIDCRIVDSETSWPIFSTDEMRSGENCDACMDIWFEGEWIDNIPDEWTRCISCNNQEPVSYHHSVGDSCNSCGGPTEEA